MTKEALSFLRNIPSLQHVPQSTLITVFAVCAVLAFFVVFIVLLMITGYVGGEKEVNKENKTDISHKLIVDMQKALVKEMRGTSMQNWLMIILTILFIAVTVFGGSFFIVLTNKAKMSATSVFPQIIRNVQNLFGK